MPLHIFRVLVRGRFGPIDASAKARLLADVDAHGVASAGFTESGTLTYDASLDSFGFRQQVRVRADDGEPDAEAEARAVAQAERSAAAALGALGATARDARSSATDMASVWRRPGGSPRR